MAKSIVAKHSVIGAAALIGLTGCSSISNLVEPNKIDYKSASKATTVSLEVPPDLTQIRRDSRFAVPDANKSTATASGYNLEKSGQKASSGNVAVAPLQLKDMRIMKDGTQRWLVVKQSPEALWPQLKDFWQELGFLVNVENPEAGVMETDWAENRAKIPQDIIRNTLGKVIDSLYSTGERDKFRTRIERGQNGEVEIYISHRGAQEVVTGTNRDGTVWQARANDASLEAEFLSRLMARLGADPETAKSSVTAAAEVKARSKVLKKGDMTYVEVDEAFDRSWRRVGLALDRGGFTVEDRDRSQGVYFVRYVDQDVDAKTKGASEGFFSRLFSFGSKDDAKTPRFRILVKNAGDNGEASHVSVHNDDGKVETSPVATKILTLLNEQLK